MSDQKDMQPGHPHQGTNQQTAGAFDVRVIIGGLIGVYGLILLGLGLFHANDAELDRADGLNLNLWAGLGMLVFGIVFIAWARLRPVVVPEDPGPPAEH